MASPMIVDVKDTLGGYYRPLVEGDLELVGNGLVVSTLTQYNAGGLIIFLLLSLVPLAINSFLCLVVTYSRNIRASPSKAKSRYASPRYLNSSARDIFGVKKIWDAAQHKRRDVYLHFAQGRFSQLRSNTYGSKLFGNLAIDTIDPKNIQIILGTNFHHWSLGESRNQEWAPLLGQGIFAADGHEWRSSRIRLRPSATLDVATHFPMFESLVQSFIRICTARRECPIDLSKLFFRFTLDTSTQLFLGKCCGSLQTAVDTLEGSPASTANSSKRTSLNAFTNSFNRAQKTLADKLVLGKWSSLILGRKRDQEFAHDCSTVLNFIGECVQSAVDDLERHKPGQDMKTETEKTGKVFLHNLIDAGADLEDAKFDLVNVLVAGRDTTASLLSCLWFELARAPHAYQKIHQEISEVLDCMSRQELQAITPSNVQLKSMKYLRACIDETLRLYPPVPLNGRTALRDTILPVGGGSDGAQPMLIRKGTRVAYNTYALHRRTDIWGDDANQFRPDRWLEPQHQNKRGSWEFIPFSGGPRVCLGQHLALAQAMYVTCRLIQHFPAIQAEGYDPAGDIERLCALRAGEDFDSIEGMGHNTRYSSTGPSAAWKWREGLTLTLTSGDGTWVSLS